MDVRSLIVAFGSRLANLPIPGRYVAVDLLGRLLAIGGSEVMSTVGDYRVAFDLRDTIQRQMAFGIYEPQIKRTLLSRVKAGDTVYDVGANVGYFSLIAAELVGPTGRVHSFEPIPTNADRLRDFVRENGISNITVVEAAVTDTIGEVLLNLRFDHSQNSGGASVVSSDLRPTILTVPSITLDSYTEAQSCRPALIKIDIEAGEPAALSGATKLIARYHPDLVVEVNRGLLTQLGLGDGDIVDPLFAQGYQIWEINTLNSIIYQPSRKVISNIHAIHPTKSSR